MKADKTKLDFLILGPKIMKVERLFETLDKLISQYELNACLVHEEESDKVEVEGFADFPILLINEQVVSRGKILTVSELIRLLNRVLPTEEALLVQEELKTKKKIQIKWRMIVFVIAIIIFLIAKVNWSPEKNRSELMTMKDSIQQEYNYLENNKNFQITFFEFGSEYCKPCKMMEPVIDQIIEDYNGEINMIYIDVRDTLNDSLCNYYNINLIPFQLLLDREANVFYKNYGYVSFDSLSSVINSKLKKP